MSDYYVSVIPTDPYYVPTEQARAAAKALFEALVYPADADADPQLMKELTEMVSEDVAFIHGFQLFERVACPCCGTTLARDWWGGAMTTAHTAHPVDLMVTVPCCLRSISLNDLIYHFPAGFARYELSALYPRISSLTVSQLDQLGVILGCHLRQIWQRV